MKTSETPEDARISMLAKALAHPARVRILRLLVATPGCIGGDIVGAVGLAQSTVSEHLRLLKSAGVILGEIEGARLRRAEPRPVVRPDGFHRNAELIRRQGLRPAAHKKHAMSPLERDLTLRVARASHRVLAGAPPETPPDIADATSFGTFAGKDARRCMTSKGDGLV